MIVERVVISLEAYDSQPAPWNTILFVVTSDCLNLSVTDWLKWDVFCVKH